MLAAARTEVRGTWIVTPGLGATLQDSVHVQLFEANTELQGFSFLFMFFWVFNIRSYYLLSVSLELAF